MSADRITLFCLHGLGLSKRLYDVVAEALDTGSQTDIDEDDTRAGIELVALDSPGFGDDPAPEGPMFEAAIAHAEEQILRTAPTRWAIAGHSYGGKVATVVASRAISGTSGLTPPVAVAMIAASPPTPEPIPDEARAQMLGWASGENIAPEAARTFVNQNIAGPLSARADEIAVGDARRSAPSAWRSWLTDGSLQNRAIGLEPLDVPAVVIAGAADGSLGAEAQRELVLPHYPRAELVIVDGAAHFVPLEQPSEIAALFRSLLQRV
jgi:pimeloyl-ACP methyl ester carboxylesterase